MRAHERGSHPHHPRGQPAAAQGPARPDEGEAVGRRPRPMGLVDLMRGRWAGAAYDKAVYDKRVRSAVAECVRKQVQSGIDIVSDGEQSKSGFFSYVRERLE